MRSNCLFFYSGSKLNIYISEISFFLHLHSVFYFGTLHGNAYWYANLTIETSKCMCTTGPEIQVLTASVRPVLSNVSQFVITIVWIASYNRELYRYGHCIGGGGVSEAVDEACRWTVPSYSRRCKHRRDLSVGATSSIWTCLLTWYN